MKPVDTTKHKGTFFKILQQTDKSQICVMTIRPKNDSGPEEVHDGDQIVYIVEGEADVKIKKEKYQLKTGDIVTIPTGNKHHIYNSGAKDLFFLTMYAPPQY